ncbi:FAD-dependent oxidoreductase [Noviherbaspirillum pedocola]|uniref:FAD-dependent oxidoreductase n=1 Tax=Noviherbaspirillum pedocola TaxID=2801341 RepID=A0A934SX25_9BURK|nr:FAD-dependent oxidoreductase [Noviherbaspirillum pedocola]MBK4738135.1 FAD-dependent oxidoreductase [Noviherbaspirillum pedocola]
MRDILIIGAGMAGYTLARELRRIDKTVPLTISTADEGGFYSKPMLSNAFAQKKAAAQLLTQSAQQMATQLNATVLSSTRISNIDTAAKTVTTSQAQLSYDKLVLATGADPIRLNFEGDAADAVMSVNHIDDYARFRDSLEATEAGRQARVAILGAGLIGCEFADDLAGGGHAVTLIDPSPLPLAALAAPALSEGLRAALIARGVELHLGTTASRIDRAGNALRLTLADGGSIEADIVLSAVGLRPNTTLARAAGIACGRGILIDAEGRTSAPDVFALGDCAEYTMAGGNTAVMPYIAPLMSAARAIAKTLSGEPTAIDMKPAPVLVKTPSYPLALLPPPRDAVGNWEHASDAQRLIARFYDETGVLAGFGVSHHDAGSRNQLLAALGSAAPEAADNK